MPILPLLAAALSTPQPGESKSFGDWAVACDNGWRCEAVSLVPETGDFDTALRAVITVEPGPDPAVTLAFELETLPKGPARLVIDGAPGLPLGVRDGALVLNGAAARAAVAALANARTIELRAGTTLVGTVSAKGSSATLRYIDAAARRAGTSSAFVARGTASVVPTPPPLPVVTSAKIAPRPVAAPGKPLALQLRKLAGCTDETAQPDEAISASALDAGVVLYLVPCGAGAYNFSSIALIAKAGKTARALFDFSPGEGEDGQPMLVNADWDPKSLLLATYSKGRGLGDCGAARDYAWDGSRFRLIKASFLDECRGASHWPVTWRAVLRP